MPRWNSSTSQPACRPRGDGADSPNPSLSAVGCCWPSPRHLPAEDNTNPGPPPTLGRRFLLLCFRFLHLRRGTSLSGTRACRLPLETSHQNDPTLLPEAWIPFSFRARCHRFQVFVFFVGCGPAGGLLSTPRRSHQCSKATGPHRAGPFSVMTILIEKCSTPPSGQSTPQPVLPRAAGNTLRRRVLEPKALNSPSLRSVLAGPSDSWPDAPAGLRP